METESRGYFYDFSRAKVYRFTVEHWKLKAWHSIEESSLIFNLYHKDTTLPQILNSV